MYYYDLNNSGKKVLYHDCHREKRQITPSLNSVIEWGYDEDGYFRGLRQGRFSKMFEGSPYNYHVIKCKTCGEEVHLDNLGRIQ